MRARSFECTAAAVLFALVASNTERLHAQTHRSPASSCTGPPAPLADTSLYSSLEQVAKMLIYIAIAGMLIGSAASAADERKGLAEPPLCSAVMSQDGKRVSPDRQQRK